MAAGEAEPQSANVLLYAVVGIYVLVLIATAKVAHARKQRAAFVGGEVRAHFSGSYSAPVLLLTTFSTVYSGFTVTGIPSEAYHRGFVSLRWIGATLVIVAGMLLLYPRLRRLAVQRGYTSPNDFIADRFRTVRLRVLCAACGCIPMLIYVTAQMISFAAMVEGMTFNAVPKWASMLAFCVIILGLEMLGGMNSVVLTDAVQSVVMLCSFIAVPFFLGAHYGFLPEMASANCPFLVKVMPKATDASLPPPQCFAAESSDCVAAGCIAAVRPEFYEYPSRSTMWDIAFFLLNMLAAPLQPHMVQRAYIAHSDSDLRIVMAAMLLAPFIAQTPGILIGLTKSANDPAWPAVAQTTTAFSAVTDQLLRIGPFQYFLVTVMTCSTLAAIMSTADSALMGASSVVSIDVFKGIIAPSASMRAVVRAGELNSFVFCAAAFSLGVFLSVEQMGAIIVFQNGMLMQILPAFGLGLYFAVKECAIALGVVVGLVSLVIMVFVGNPLDGYVPVINVAVIFNAASVALVQATVPDSCVGSDCKPAEGEGSAQQTQLGAQLTPSDIREVMSSSREPSTVLALVMLALGLVSVPWYGSPGEPEPMIAGLPRWGFVQCMLWVAICVVGLVATWQWRPPALSVAQGPQFADITVHSPAAAQVPPEDCK